MLNIKQSLALAALRVTLGFLLIWWGLSKVLAPTKGVKISDRFYHGLFSNDALQYYFGYVQVVVGICVAIGLWKRFAVPAQVIITGGSSLAIWNALLDPFALYLPVAKVAPVQHLFYPSAIALAAAVFLITLRDYDIFCVDHWLSKRKTSDSDTATIPAE